MFKKLQASLAFELPSKNLLYRVFRMWLFNIEILLYLSMFVFFFCQPFLSFENVQKVTIVWLFTPWQFYYFLFCFTYNLILNILECNK